MAQSPTNCPETSGKLQRNQWKDWKLCLYCLFSGHPFHAFSRNLLQLLYLHDNCCTIASTLYSIEWQNVIVGMVMSYYFTPWPFRLKRYCRCLCLSVYLSVCSSVRKLNFINMITRHKFELESPNRHKHASWDTLDLYWIWGHWPWPSRSCLAILTGNYMNSDLSA